MAITHEVAIRFQDGVELDVFDAYTMRLSMFDHGNPVTFTCWYSREAQAAWDYLLSNVKCFDPFTITVDGAIQMAGVITSVEPYADAHEARFEISGRDMCALAQEADVSPTLSAKSSTLEQVIEQMFAPLGVTVVAGASAGDVRDTQLGRRPRGRPAKHPRKPPVDKFHPPVGERIWAAAERLCRRHGYLLWAAPYDVDTIAVVIDRPGYDQEPTYQLTRRLARDGEDDDTQDSNILAGGLRVSVDGIPTSVSVYGDGDRGDTTPSRVAHTLENDRFDQQYVRRPLRTIPRHMKMESGRGPRHAEQTARKTLDGAMRQHRQYRCTVQGHGQPYQGDPEASVLYAINTVARIRDDKFSMDEDMLIESVEFRRSVKEGTTTRLVMHTLGAVQCDPDPDA